MKKFSKEDFIKQECKYIRVGVDYFKVLHKQDRYNIERTELKKWKKEEITQDHGKQILFGIDKYDDFVMIPDNLSHTSVSGSFYNLYAPFTHCSAKGLWPWTDVLLHHIFGEQFDIGIKYLQVLYLHPKQALPVLALVSKDRQTGKSTFIDWLMTIFGANMVIISPDDLSRQFNGSYSRANIIAIEETLIRKDQIVEKVKSLSTQKTINANLKNVNDFQIPFFGKIILASNNERKFMKIDSEEIRFFVRKLPAPKITNHNILNDMISEIPAFLNHLQSLPEIDFSKSRMVFSADEIKNDYLAHVKDESHTWLYKELHAIFEDVLNNSFAGQVMMATPKEIKETYFQYNAQVTSSFIKDVLIEEFKFIKTNKNVSYKSLSTQGFKVGQPYFIPKSSILNGEKVQNIDFYEKDLESELADNQMVNEFGVPF